MPSKCNQHRIFISRTESEWKTIEKRLEEIGRSDFNAYVRRRLSLLQKRFDESPKSVFTSVERRTKRPHIVPSEYIKMLDTISVKTGLPFSTIVDRLIVDPLILAK